MSEKANLGTGIHATAVVHRETGVLIIGPSGSGKSALALALLGRSRSEGVFGALIGDDRVWVRNAGGRLIASSSPEAAGLIERRKVGLIAARIEPVAVMGLAVELSGPKRSWPRMPDDPDVLTIEGIVMPRLALESGQSAADQALAVDERLGMMAADRARQTAILLEHCAALHKNGKLVRSPPAGSTPEARVG